jgi:hypothetical protein
MQAQRQPEESQRTDQVRWFLRWWGMVCLFWPVHLWMIALIPAKGAESQIFLGPAMAWMYTYMAREGLKNLRRSPEARNRCRAQFLPETSQNRPRLSPLMVGWIAFHVAILVSLVSFYLQHRPTPLAICAYATLTCLGLLFAPSILKKSGESDVTKQLLKETEEEDRHLQE